MSDRRKIGFIVEGEVDRLIVEVFARRILGDAYLIYAVRLGGQAALPWAYVTAFKFVEKDYEKIILLFDADTIDEDEIDRKRRQVEETMREHGMEEAVSVCVAVPEIEAWLLAGSSEKPEVPDARALLLKGAARDLETLRRLAGDLDLEQARRRSPSLNHFLQVLESVRDQQLQAA